MIALLFALAVLCALALALRWPGPAAMLWILALETSPGAWMDQILGTARHELVVGAMKSCGLVLAALVALRCGARRDRYNPAFAFGAMFFTGLLHGLHPGLTLLSSLRSLIGSAAPFIFAFTRMTADFCAGVIRAALWAPLAATGAGAVLAACGLGHMYVLEQGALRLGAAGEPAVLAGFALIGIYAGLMEAAAAPRFAPAAAIAVNFIIILLTGARAPLAVALFDILALLLLQRRLRLIIAGIALACAAVLLAPWLGFLRVIDLTRLGEAGDLSNRTLVWPYFQQAILASPWFGWGVGAGKIIIPLTSPIGQLLGTNAAHDEYLRIGAEGGIFGLALLLLLLILWAGRGSAPLAPAPRLLMRVIFIGFTVHSGTDNTMIATTSSVFFLWVSCIFAKARNPATGAA